MRRARACCRSPDRTTRFLHRWLVTLATVGSVAWLTAALLILSGMQLQAHLPLALAVGALMALLLSAMVLSGRPLVAAALLGDQAVATPLRLRVARSWHVFAIAYLIVVGALWASSIVTRGPSSIWSAVASVLLAAAMPVLGQAFGRGIAEVLGSDGTAAPSRERTIGMVRNAVRVLLAAVGLVLLPSFWGVDVLIGAPGTSVFSHALFNILVPTLLAYVVWQLAEAALDRSFATGDPTGIPI